MLACGDLAIVSPQNPVRLDRLNLAATGFRHPPAARRSIPDRASRPGRCSRLLVEVADSSLRFDCTVKLPLYAKAGIPRSVDRGPQAPCDGRLPPSTRRRI